MAYRSVALRGEPYQLVEVPPEVRAHLLPKKCMLKKVLVSLLLASVVSFFVTPSRAVETWDSQEPDSDEFVTDTPSTFSPTPVSEEAGYKRAFATVLLFMGFCVLGTAYHLYLNQREY